ncbi:tripartite tricarboxylate transporter permease [Pseudalkalibacillus salsuginis]|uniref:tripartite tricarboxylate transporter permease n=1 Tax=Pseudalkalibacillus salsuginis TaxID=2910972 RepID=UPI001F28A073|nr:tripartite tricarboxylate transporter permease [Pseudalkalibacillus salsuginis]MCF6411596.1 tripartite tricarboxylate transporter permease [Pseudalkalibacillus salsuginis]
MFENLLSGFDQVFQIYHLIGLLAGILIGYFIGAMPGLTPSIGIALIIPFTFTMEPVMAMILIVSLYMAAEYGGGITAILLNAPGTPAAAATAFDGFELTKRGEAGKALTISIVASAIGALISSILLIFTAVPMASFALEFGPTEYFALAIFGLSLVSSLSQESLLKGMLSMLLGLLIITIGLDPVMGTPRFVFSNGLFEGVPFLPALIGLFALSEVFYMLENVKEKPPKEEKLKGIGAPLSLFKKMWLTLLRAPILGYVIGVIPGAGTTIASLVSYNEAKRVSKQKETFGKGNPEGIAASEGANNAAVSGAFAPLLALGIPGSASAAIIIGALTIQGVQPGPLLFTENPEIPYSIFAALLVGVPIMAIVGLSGVRLWAKVVLIPRSILAVFVSGICVLGAYSYSNSMFPVWVMIIFGIFGYLLRKTNVPTTPMVLALVLGAMMETNFRRAITVSGGDYTFFFHRPITLVLLILSIGTLLLPIIQRFRKSRA